MPRLLPAFLAFCLPLAAAAADRRLPPLERMSSGALLRLDRDGDLVRPPSGRLVPRPLEGTMLDLRVGPNIRLGDDPAALPGNLRAQAEPHITRSATDPDFLVATFQEGRFTNGGAFSCGYSVSRDGGLTWTRALIPSLVQSQGGPYFRATDPVAGITRSGTILLNTLVAESSAFEDNAIVVSRSTDGGQTFLPHSVVVRSPVDRSTVLDKNWMAVNTNPGGLAAGRILVTYTAFGASDFSPIVCTYSDDGGSTWTRSAEVHAATTNAQGSQPVFFPDGRAAVVFWNFGTGLNDPNQRIESVTSADGGVTFAPAVRVANAVLHTEPSIRTGAFLPSAATDRTTNSLYVTYVTRDGPTARAMFVKSTDAGATWGSPRVISDNPIGTGLFNATISASPDGQSLTVVFHDRRLNPNSTVLVDTFVAQSFDGGTTWQPNLRVSSMSTDASLAPLTGSGYMIGDYLGIAEAIPPNVPAVPVWIDTRSGNSDPYVARVAASAQTNFASWQAARLSLAQINNPALGGEAGDADGDREDNLSEFRSQTDPQSAGSAVRSARAINLSTRLRVQTGDNILIGGFVLSGTVSKRVIVRALGPTLSGFGIAGALANPTLELRNAAGGVVATNEDWRDTQATEITASGFAPPNDLESAIVATLAPGAYTALVRGRDGTSGVGLVEVYDLETGVAARLINVSTRGRVEGGENVMIGGFVAGAGLGTNGSGSVRVVVRGIGPSLSAVGVPGALTDPTLELRNSAGALVASNDNWQDTQQAALTATGFAPSDLRESAILATLPQGAYTAIVRGKDGSAGVALVEVYEVP